MRSRFLVWGVGPTRLGERFALKPVVETWPPDVFDEIEAAVVNRSNTTGEEPDFADAWVFELSAEETDLDAARRYDEAVIGYRTCGPGEGVF